MRKIILGVGFALALGNLTPSQAAEFLVKMKSPGIMMTLNNVKGMKVLDQHVPGQLMKVDVSDFAKIQVLTQILRSPNVEYAVPNFKLHRFGNPASFNDTVILLKDQWALKKVHAQEAWDKAGNKGNKKIIVAVIDTGVDYNHNDLKTNMVPGYNFKDNNNDPMDKTGMQNPGHGTHCAGIIGATGATSNGTMGISPDVSIMPIRFLDENGSGDLMDGIKAIDFAIEKGAKVISASWGATVSRSEAQPLVEAVKRADDAGVIFVVAAANDGKNNDKTEVYPANAGFPNTIAVAASDSNDGKPSWTNYGQKTVHLAAPGNEIMSTLPRNSYGNLSGTSMATPLVSGLTAFLLAQNEHLTGAQIRALLQSTGTKLSIETACNCRVDALAAVTQVLDKKAWIVPAAGTLKINETMQFSVMNAQGAIQYESSNPSVAKVTDTGLLTALAVGDVTVKAKDPSGVLANSLTIHVNDGSGGGGDEPSEECMLGDPLLCELACQFMPELPWCKQ